ncbi:hypothetical protein HS1genome_1591 [Sulfodiicoccus acidiphilus]|uniref:HTH arsR-type domain-containing protein n=1 Tax=Sulfodiicoccus acidiphilus TaxID=1670455 RepID=A0A348B4V0_9CREN|nr:ArsR family transcriptional regulator [Sulfodiicoccus acidiphilus]BBD73202.1 hypothetical protein HS1genome_1591 [Sulfodiicoccus acidiphilus]GGU01461.1 hypothetical protein GCM10007116_18360 [Sulfodiicoccus acidiphilus]
MGGLTGAKARESEILQVIADEINLTILSILRGEPTFVRRLAQQMGMKESHVSERLRRMEETGLVRGKWVRLAGKNVKVYYPKIDTLEINLTQMGFVVRGREVREEVIIPKGLTEDPVPKVSHFVGRRAELELLRSLSGPVLVWGIPGIGKTTLVAKFIRESGLENRTFWYTCREVDSFQYFVGKFSGFLLRRGHRTLPEYVMAGVNDISTLLDLAVDETMQNEVVAVLDNFDLCRDHVVKLFSNRLMERNGSVFLTSRRPMGGPSNLRELHLQGITENEVREFLNSECRKPIEEVGPYAQKLKGHPLGLRMLCLSGDVRESTSDVRNLEEGKHAGSSSGWSFSRWLATELRRTVTEDQMRILEQLSVFDSPVDHDSLRRLIRVKGFMSSLKELEDMLLVANSGGTYSLPDSLRETVYEYSSHKEELHRKAALYYMKGADPLSRLEAMRHLVKAGEEEEALALVRDVNRIATAGLLENVYELFRGVSEEEVSPEGRVRLKYFKALYSYFTGKVKESIEKFEEVEGLVRLTKDWNTHGQLLFFLCSAYIVINDYDRAEQVCGRGMRTYEGRSGPWFRKLATLMAEIHEEKGKLDEALTLLHRALEEVDDTDIEGRSPLLHQMAMVYYRKGEFDKSKALAEVALDEFRKLHNLFATGHCEWGIGSILVEQGKPTKAMEYYDMAVEDLSKSIRLGHLAVCLAERGVLNLRLGNVARAREDIERVRSLMGRVQGPLMRGIIMRGLGIYTAEVEGNVKKGISMLNESLKLIDGLVADEKGLTLWALGLLEAKEGMKEQALSHLREAQRTLREAGWTGKASEVEKAISALLQEGTVLYPDTARSYL